MADYGVVLFENAALLFPEKGNKRNPCSQFYQWRSSWKRRKVFQPSVFLILLNTMKLFSVIVVSFFLAAAVLQLEGSPLARDNPKSRWTTRHPFQAIVKRVVRKTVSPAQTSKYNVKFINLSEELKAKQKQKTYPSSSLPPTPNSAVKENKKHDKKNKNSNIITQNIIGIWGPGVHLQKDKSPKFSLMKFVLKSFKSSRTQPSERNKIPKAPSPPPPPLAVPVEPEMDSYLKALEESRIPCQKLEDPTDCDDFSHLFKPYWSYNYDTSTLLPNQGLLSSAALYNEYSSSVKDVIDSSQFQLAQPSSDSNDFLLQKPILFLSPSFETIIEAESPSADPSIESQTPSLDSLVDTSGLSVVGPLTNMKVVPTHT